MYRDFGLIKTLWYTFQKCSLAFSVTSGKASTYKKETHGYYKRIPLNDDK